MRLFFFIMFFLISAGIGLSQPFTFSGQIFDEAGTPLAYTGVMTSDLSLGTLSDENGKFTLRLPEKGVYVFVFQYLGYKDLYDTIPVERNIVRNYRMQKEDLSTEEVIITSDGKDPAFGIIARAIEEKDRNAKPFSEYGYASYTKTVIGFPKSFRADSLLGQGVGLDFGIKRKKSKEEENTELPPELKSKILYLSETMSEVFIKEPEKAKEKIVSSRVSGDSKSYSLFGNLISRFNPYENRLLMEGVADRGIILPLAENAFFYYDFKLIGTKTDKGTKYYKIQILPKREYDPVCKGVIYITDSSYAIREIDINVNKSQNINMMDTLRLHQQYSEFQGKFLPYTTRMGFDFIFDLGVIKLPLQGFSISLLSEYNIMPATGDKKRFGNEIIAVSDSATNKPKVYWDYYRPLPLTHEEEADFRLKDSLEFIKNSPRYLDSLQRLNNRLDFMQWLSLGQTFRYHKQNLSLRIAPLLETVSFNPIEGGILKPDFTLKKELEKNKSLSFSTVLRYGFSNRKFRWKTGLVWENAPKHFSKWSLEGGDYVFQFSGFEQIDVYIHAIRCLSYKSNFMRLFQQKYAELKYERELFNGFMAGLTGGFYHRTGLSNTTEFSFTKIQTPYEANLIPDNPLFPSQGFQPNNALIAMLNLRYQPGTEYISIPYGKTNLGSKYPVLELGVTKAFGYSDNSADYLKAKLTVSDDMSLGILGVLKYEASYGRFLAQKRVYFPDLWHFKGNQTRFRDDRVAQFSLMPYYLYSGRVPFIELHAEQAFHGFLMNKIPLIRKWKLEEYTGAHFLWNTQLTQPYLEMNFGVEKKILKILPLRMEFCLNLTGIYYKRSAFMFTSPPIDAFSGSLGM